MFCVGMLVLGEDHNTREFGRKFELDVQTLFLCYDDHCHVLTLQSMCAIA